MTISTEELGKMLDADGKTYDLQVVKWEGGIRCIYLNDYRVAGEKPWGGGETIRTFKVTMADVMGSFRGTVQSIAPDLATELLAARAKLEAAEKLAEAAGDIFDRFSKARRGRKWTMLDLIASDKFQHSLAAWEAAQ